LSKIWRIIPYPIKVVVCLLLLFLFLPFLLKEEKERMLHELD